MISETTTATTATTAEYDVPIAEATPIGLVFQTYGSGDDRDIIPSIIDSKDDDSWVSQWSDVILPEDEPTQLDPRKVVVVIATLVFTAYLMLVYYYVVTGANSHNNDSDNILEGASRSAGENLLYEHSSLSTVMQHAHHLRHDLTYR